MRGRRTASASSNASIPACSRGIGAISCSLRRAAGKQGCARSGCGSKRTSPRARRRRTRSRSSSSRSDASVPGSVTIVGTGVAVATQLTPEARAAIDRADDFLHVAADPLAATWLDGLHENARSLTPLYEAGGPRAGIYSRMADEIVAPARAGRRVCAAFYGHPGVFATPAHTAVRRARAAGVAARMLPAISAQDCLVADLGVDPAEHGWLSYDATDFLLHRRPIDAACALALWQIGVVGETGAVADPKYRHLDLVADRLAEVYGKEHEVVVYEASAYPVAQPIIERVRIDDLPSAPITGLATLYVPPSSPPLLDQATAARLGIATPS